MIKKLFLVLALGILTTPAVDLWAQVIPYFENLPGFSSQQEVPRQYGFHYERGIRKYINSFASYQFPDQTHTIDPLSRLESPLDQWFIGARLFQSYSTLTFGAELWTNLNRESNLKFQDSDWGEGGFPPYQKTIFSETDSRIERAYLLDIFADWGVASFKGASIRPVIGFRWQDLRFLEHDGYQKSITGGYVGPLDGDVILNEYNFKNFYAGAKTSFSLRGFTFSFQGDYGWLKADLFDHHIMRGELGGPMTGTGYCLHLNAGIESQVRSYLNLKIEADFLRLVANNCTMEDYTEDGQINGVWGGARIWSDQQSISAYGEVRF